MCQQLQVLLLVQLQLPLQLSTRLQHLVKLLLQLVRQVQQKDQMLLPLPWLELRSACTQNNILLRLMQANVNAHVQGGCSCGTCAGTSRADGSVFRAKQHTHTADALTGRQEGRLLVLLLQRSPPWYGCCCLLPWAPHTELLPCHPAAHGRHALEGFQNVADAADGL
jgi:hypothetical protein